MRTRKEIVDDLNDQNSGLSKSIIKQMQLVSEEMVKDAESGLISNNRIQLQLLSLQLQIIQEMAASQIEILLDIREQQSSEKPS